MPATHGTRPATRKRRDGVNHHRSQGAPCWCGRRSFLGRHNGAARALAHRHRGGLLRPFSKAGVTDRHRAAALRSAHHVEACPAAGRDTPLGRSGRQGTLG